MEYFTMLGNILDDLNKNYSILEKDECDLKKYIKEKLNEISELEDKYYQIIRVREYLESFSEIDYGGIIVENVFFFSKDGIKIYPLKNRKNYSLIIPSIVKDAIEEHDYYKYLAEKLFQIVQNHIDRLELVQKNLYKIKYAIDYLKLGIKSIEINNLAKYSYSPFLYANSLGGCSTSKLANEYVAFTPKEIVFFVKNYQKE